MIYYILTFKTNFNVEIQTKLENYNSEYIETIQMLKIKIPIKYKYMKLQLEKKGKIFIYGYEFKDILNGSYA